MLFRINDLSYDDATGIVIKDKKEYKLTKIQMKLFNYFIVHPKQILSKETLMQEVWGRIVTENTINKFISTLRSYIEENPSKPQIIVTRFGHGLSFEGKVTNQYPLSKERQEETKNNKPWVFITLLFGVVIVLLAWLYITHPNRITSEIVNLRDTKHVLVLPTKFTDLDVSEIQQVGLGEMMRSTFNSSDSEGKIVFDQTNLGNREAIEKYWQLDKDLIVLKSQVLKNGDIYEAVINLSQGSKVLNQTTLRARNLNDLLENQIEFISSYQNKRTNENNQQAGDTSITLSYIEALGHKKLGNLSKAKELLKQVLKQEEKHYQARFELAKINILEKAYNEGLSQLYTLKSTKAYQNVGTEIELALAKIYYIKHDYELLIDSLKKYQAEHLSISKVKKSKIKLQIAQAYLAQSDLQNGMKFFQQAIMNIDENFNPHLYAQSYYGQGLILAHQSNEGDVYDYFNKTLSYAKLAGNLEYQILALDEMSKMLLVSNEWERGIELKKQALEIMELNNDKSQVAQGLGTLAAFLIQAGHFSEAEKINNRLGKIAKELNLDSLYLNYLHYDAVLLLNVFKFEEAKIQIDKQLVLSIKTKNYGMQLDNAFLEFELRLAKKDTLGFKQEWDKRTQLIKDLGFERYQVYMDLYLARFYKQMGNTEEAAALISDISGRAKTNNDIKILVDAQNQLAEMYLDIDAKNSLEILLNIEQYKPDANPYLELKALALNKLGRKIEALNLLNQAKLVFHEAWKSENQILLEQLEQELRL